MQAETPQLEESTMDDSDPYDPRKPEYIAEATQEEVEKTNAELLARQIAKLEAATAHRKERGGKVVGHYKSVVATLRDKEAAIMGKFSRRGKFSHARVRSEPVAITRQQSEELATKRGRFETVEQSGLVEFDEDDELTGSFDESSMGDEDDEPSVQSVRRCPAWRAPVHDKGLLVPGALELPLPGTLERESARDSSTILLMKEGI